MLWVVAGFSGVFEDVQVGGSLAVRLEVGRPYKRSNHSRVAEDLQEEAQVDLGRKYFQYFIFLLAKLTILSSLVWWKLRYSLKTVFKIWSSCSPWAEIVAVLYLSASLMIISFRITGQ